MNSLDHEYAAELAGRIDAALAERGRTSGILLHDDTIDWLTTSSREEVTFFLVAEHILDATFPYLPQEPEEDDIVESPVLRLSRKRVDMARKALANVCVD